MLKINIIGVILAVIAIISGIVFIIVELGYSLTTLTVLISIFMFIAATWFSIAIYDRLNRKKKEKDVDLKIYSTIESMRDRLENQLNTIENRLMANEERWKDVNHLLLSSQKALPEKFKVTKVPILTDFLRGFGLTENDMYIDQNLVFVLTPFNESKRDTYNVIADVCNKVNLKCMRGDEEFIRGDILQHIIRLLVRARLVIANIDGRNPNVFYELGIAHAIDKPIIIVSSSLSDTPFDIKSKHLIIYKDKISLKNELRNALLKAFIKE